jgi:hypothetical protein
MDIINSNFFYSEGRHDVLVVLEVYLFLFLLLGAVGHAAVDDQLLLAQRLRFLLLK